MSNTKHTEGKAQLSKNGQVVYIGVISICNTFGHLKSEEENKANANRIVTVWNGYDKLKSDNEKLNLILKNITEGYFNGSTIQEVEINMRAAKNILKKANPKIEFKSPPQSLLDRHMEKWDLPQ